MPIKGQRNSPETIAKMSAAQTGKHNKPANPIMIKGDIVIMGMKGCICILDKADYDIVKGHRWRYGSSTVETTTYTKLNGKWKPKVIAMYRMIAGEPPKGMVTDHINGNRLDSRRSNLRFVTRSQNVWNRAKHVYWNKGIVKSPSRGVYQNRFGNFTAKLFVNGRYVLNRTVEDLDEAIKLRHNAEIEHFGEYRRK